MGSNQGGHSKQTRVTTQGLTQMSRRSVLQSTTAIGLGSLSSIIPSTAQESGGEQVWQFQTGGAIASSSPTVADETVYIGSDDGNIYALDTADGSEQWSFQTGQALVSAPAVANDMVYIGGQNGTVYALDAESGSVEWTVQTGYSVWSSPTVTEGSVYIGSQDNSMYAYDASDGSEQWAVDTGNRITVKPAVADGTVYIANWDDILFAFDATDGDEEWRVRNSEGYTSPVVDDGTVYVGSGDGMLYALNTTGGAEKWSFQMGQGELVSRPTVAGDTVYVGGHDDTVYAIDTADATEQWRFQTGHVIHSSPAVVGDTVYVGSADDILYALSAVDGNIKWQFQTGGPVECSPAVANGVVYFGSGDHNVYAVATGAEPTDSSETDQEEAITIEIVDKQLVVGEPPVIRAEIAGPETITHAEMTIDGIPPESPVAGEQVASKVYEFTFPEMVTEISAYRFEITATDSSGRTVSHEGRVASLPAVYEREHYYSVVYGIGEEIEPSEGGEFLFEQGLDFALEKSTTEAMKRILERAGVSAAQSTGALVGQFVSLGFTFLSFAKPVGGRVTSGQLWAITEDGLQQTIEMAPSGGAIDPAFHIYQGSFIGDLYLSVTADTKDYYLLDRKIDDEPYPTLTVPDQEVFQLAYLKTPLVFSPEGRVSGPGGMEYDNYEMQLSIEGANGDRTLLDSVRITVQEQETAIDGDQDGSAPVSSEDGPGFGIGETITALGGASYLLKRKLR